MGPSLHGPSESRKFSKITRISRISRVLRTSHQKPARAHRISPIPHATHAQLRALITNHGGATRVAQGSGPSRTSNTKLQSFSEKQRRMRRYAHDEIGPRDQEGTLEGWLRDLTEE
eukprot:2116676-Prymnesium_polylepis.1